MDAANGILSREGYLVWDEDPELWIQRNPSHRLSVRRLKLDYSRRCGSRKIDSIGEFKELIHLSIHDDGTVTQLPDNLPSLRKLKVLHLYRCNRLRELPPNLGDLYTLTSLSLRGCNSIKSLPGSLGNLSNLTDLFISHCYNLEYCVSLRHLKFWDCSFHKPKEFPLNVDKLPQLSLLDIQDTGIKCLPSSISKLSKLRLLLLPYGFLLDTLPYDLDESLVISVKDTHVRKTWKKLKTEMEIFSSHTVGDCFSIKQLAPDLDVMVNLCILNLSGTRIKSLPDCISKLPKLQCLILPKCFQPGSLPREFRNQLLVSFDNTDDKYYEDMGYYDSNHETSDESDDNTTNTIESEEGRTSQQNISSHQLLDQPDATPVFKDYNFDGRDSNHINTNRHSCNQEMPENMICLNEVLKESEKRITAEQQSSRKQLLNLPDSIRDSNSIGSSDLIGKNNHRAISPSQNQEREPISLVDCDKMITDDNSSCDKTDVSHSGNSLNSLEENKKCKRQRKEITLEDIRSLIDEGMTLSDAGQELGVSERTLKRRCREVGIKEWPSSRHHDTNMREVSSRLSSMSWSNFQVKAYNVENRDIVRFDLSLSSNILNSNIDQLKYEIGRKLGLEAGKFKIKYKDDDGDLVSVTGITDLKHARSLSKDDHVRLLVIPET